MGLAINGDNVNGVAVAGNAFVSAENSMPNLVGQAIDFSKVPKDGTHKIYCFGWFGRNAIDKSKMNSEFTALSDPINSADQWFTTSTIYGETLLPANTSVAQNNPNYRSKSELFLAVYWAYAENNANYTDAVDSSSIEPPIYAWVKYDDVKDYIIPTAS